MFAMKSATRGKTAALFGAPLPAAAVMTNKMNRKKGKQETQQQKQQRRTNGKFCLISAPLKV